MKALARNRLVRIEPQAWAQIEARAWDAQAQDILAHWRINDLPLVVCRQRADSAPNQVCVGVPAPQQWSRRRLPLTMSLDQITDCTDFPTLVQVAQAERWSAAALDLASALSQLGTQAHVYGSYGWQWLTGLGYWHDTSDLDLTVEVHSFEMASLVVERLASSSLDCRIDGEIVFPQGHAIAWREFQQLIQGKTTKVLVKDRHQLRLATLEEVQRLAHATPVTRTDAVLCWP